MGALNDPSSELHGIMKVVRKKTLAGIACF